MVNLDPMRQRLPTFLCLTILTHHAAVSYVRLPFPLTDSWTLSVHGSKAGKQLPPEQTLPGEAFDYTNKPSDGPSDLLSPESPTFCVCNLGRGAFGGIVDTLLLIIMIIAGFIKRHLTTSSDARFAAWMSLTRRRK